MLKLISGYSEKDRIIFSTRKSTMTAIRREDGTIGIEFGQKRTPSTNVEIIFGIIFYTIPLAKAFIVNPLIKSGMIGRIYYLISIFLYLILVIFNIIYLRIKGGKEVLKNHAAEHMVFSAYNKLKKVPTIEETRNFSRISKSCGITIYSALIATQIIGFFVYINTGYMISELVLFISSMLVKTLFPFNLLGELAQLFTTSKPEDKNIELAIEAVSMLEKREKISQIVRDVLKP